MAVVGAGGQVGSSVANALAGGGVCDVLHLLDVRENLASAHTIDIVEAQVVAGLDGPRVTVDPPGSPADLVIVAASLRAPFTGRRRGADSPNAGLVRSLAAGLRTLAGERGIVLIVSNPVDILCCLLHRVGGIGPERILGYNLNDTVRFRAAIARELGVAPSRVAATVLGEHGRAQIPVFGSVTVDGRRVELDEAARRRVSDEIVGWFERYAALQPGRSSGWTTAAGVVQVIRMMRAGTTFPAAAWTGALPGLPDSFIALPVRFAAREVHVDLAVLALADAGALARAASDVAAQCAEAYARSS